MNLPSRFHVVDNAFEIYGDVADGSDGAIEGVPGANEAADAARGVAAAWFGNFANCTPNAYIDCMKNNGTDYRAAVETLGRDYAKCMNKCRRRKGGGCITATNRAWKWLLETPDNRTE